MKRLELSAEAELDMFEAALRYEGEREGLGFRFEVEVNRVFERIVRNPFQFGELLRSDGGSSHERPRVSRTR